MVGADTDTAALAIAREAAARAGVPAEFARSAASRPAGQGAFDLFTPGWC